MSHRLFVVEGAGTENFGPLTHFRASFELVCGILPLWRKLELQYDQHEVRLLCRESIAAAVRRRAGKVPVNDWGRATTPALLFDGRVIADAHLPSRIEMEGADDVVFVQKGEPLAARVAAASLKRLHGVPLHRLLEHAAELWPHEEVEGIHVARWPWELVHHNGVELLDDWGVMWSYERRPLHAGVVDQGAWLEYPQRIHLGTGARVHAGAVLDAENGPIYIADKVNVMPGAVIMGPAAVGEGSAIKIHAKIYAGTTIGPVCKIGGEVEDSIVLGFSNKQHDGFLGHAYLGEWINLGAGTNNSDLKNNYSTVRVKIAGREVDSGERFVGLIMGDHSKSAIGTTFNTGTVVGSCCNIFGPGFPPKSVPSFSWGGADGFVPYEVDKCIRVARTVMKRRGVDLQPDDEKAMRDLFDATVAERASMEVEALVGV